jgi:hypothetical protein
MMEHRRFGPTEIIPPLVAVAATIIWITIDGFTGESIAQALTSLCTMFVILIPIYKHVLKRPKDGHYESGLRACIEIQRKHALIICGPKYRKDNYTPDSHHVDQQFLFIQKPDSRRKAALIAIAPFKKAIVELSFSKTTMELMGISGDFSERKQQLHRSMLTFANENYRTLFMEKNVDRFENICIVLDFDIEKVTVKTFRAIVSNLLHHYVDNLMTMQKD